MKARPVSTRMTAKKRSGRKTLAHRASITKHDNGGYSVEMQDKYSDAKDEYGDRPAMRSAVYPDHKTMTEALPELFGEAHPSTAPAKSQEGDEELPE